MLLFPLVLIQFRCLHFSECYWIRPNLTCNVIFVIKHHKKCFVVLYEHKEFKMQKFKERPKIEISKMIGYWGGIRSQNEVEKFFFHGTSKAKAVQKLYECKDDFRLEFCKIIVARFNRNPHFMYNIILNDGCTFLFHGQVHKQKVWYWASKNLHWYEPFRT